MIPRYLLERCSMFENWAPVFAYLCDVFCKIWLSIQILFVGIEEAWNTIDIETWSTVIIFGLGNTGLLRFFYCSIFADTCLKVKSVK